MKVKFEENRLTLEPETSEEMHFIATMGEQLAWNENSPAPAMSRPVRLWGSTPLSDELTSFIFSRN